MQLSVILICYNKAYEMDLVLTSLCCQDQPLSDFEVIVIDDGSTDGLKAVAESYSGRLRLKYHPIEHCGERAKLRNLGCELSDAEILLFVDSDMVASRNLVSSHLNAVKDDPKSVSLGLRKNVIEYDKAFLNARMVEDGLEYIEDLPAINDERSALLQFLARDNFKLTNAWTLLFSHNFAVWRKTFLEVGRFDSLFSKNWGVEDVELGFRLQKFGCDIRMNSGSMCYHLFHPTNTENKILQLRKNLALFYNKFPEFEVELFCEEYKIGGRDYNLIRQSILEGRYLISGVTLHGYQQDLSPGKTVAMGIDPGCFAIEKKPECLLLPGRGPNGPGEMDLIGIKTTFRDKEFQTCIVSSEYGSISAPLLEKMLSEARRIAWKVLVCDASGHLSVSVQNEIPGAIALAKSGYRNGMLMFIMGRPTGFIAPYMRHNYLKLACAMQDRGWKVSFQLPYDPYQEVPRQEGFYKSADPGFCRQVESLFRTDLNFFEEEIPCVMDPRVARFTPKAIGNRIYWDGFDFQNEDKKFQKEIAPTFQKLLSQCNREVEVLRGPKMAGVVPVGVDTAKIRSCVAGLSPAIVKKPFRFLWVQPFAYHHSNFSELLQAFANAFRDGEDIELTVLHSSEIMTFAGDIFLNKAFTHLFAGFIKIMEMKYSSYEADAWEGISNVKIKQLKGVLTEEAVLEHLFDADCLVDTSGTFGISPVVLNSVALGKKPILTNPAAYQGYFDLEDCIPVKGASVSGIIFEPIPESIWQSDRADMRYMRFIKPKVDDLSAVMRRAYLDRPALRLNESRRMRFCDTFSWEKSAAALESLLV